MAGIGRSKESPIIISDDDEDEVKSQEKTRGPHFSVNSQNNAVASMSRSKLIALVSYDSGEDLHTNLDDPAARLLQRFGDEMILNTAPSGSTKPANKLKRKKADFYDESDVPTRSRHAPQPVLKAPKYSNVGSGRAHVPQVASSPPTMTKAQRKQINKHIHDFESSVNHPNTSLASLSRMQMPAQEHILGWNAQFREAPLAAAPFLGIHEQHEQVDMTMQVQSVQTTVGLPLPPLPPFYPTQPPVPTDRTLSLASSTGPQANSGDIHVKQASQLQASHLTFNSLNSMEKPKGPPNIPRSRDKPNAYFERGGPPIGEHNHKVDQTLDLPPFTIHTVPERTLVMASIGKKQRKRDFILSWLKDVGIPDQPLHIIVAKANSAALIELNSAEEVRMAFESPKFSNPDGRSKIVVYRYGPAKASQVIETIQSNTTEENVDEVMEEDSQQTPDEIQLRHSKPVSEGFSVESPVTSETIDYQSEIEEGEIKEDLFSNPWADDTSRQLIRSRQREPPSKRRDAHAIAPLPMQTVDISVSMVDAKSAIQAQMHRHGSLDDSPMDISVDIDDGDKQIPNVKDPEAAAPEDTCESLQDRSYQRLRPADTTAQTVQEGDGAASGSKPNTSESDKLSELRQRVLASKRRKGATSVPLDAMMRDSTIISSTTTSACTSVNSTTFARPECPATPSTMSSSSSSIDTLSHSISSISSSSSIVTPVTPSVFQESRTPSTLDDLATAFLQDVIGLGHFDTSSIKHQSAAHDLQQDMKIILHNKQKRLEQNISDTKQLMARYSMAPSKHEKSLIMSLIREKNKLFDAENAADDEAIRRMTVPISFTQWPQTRIEDTILTISDSESDDED